MLELNGVNSHYGKAHILNDLSFRVEPGEVVSLLGRNGAGKTTTLKSIMQLVRPSAGTVTFEGASLIRRAPHQVAKLGVGYVPEERRIFSDLTILENLEVGKQPPREGIAPWDQDRLFEIFPNLLERRHNRGKALSGNPRLLLLDEPSEGIAPVIVEQMAKTILTLKTEGLSVLLSEQNLHFARLVSDRAVIIESGEKKFDGTFAQLETDTEIRDAYLSV